jgi:D-alanine--poly(phosphoribitol) ligase subunit 1
MPQESYSAFRSKIIESRWKNPDELFFGDLNGWRSRERFWADVDNQIKKIEVCFPDKIVPILANRNYETIVAMIAVLIANKSFASLDPSQPRERLESCLGQIGYKTNAGTLEFWQCDSQPNLKFPPFVRLPAVEVLPTVALEPSSKETIAYLLFTSGSTGVPKGVQISDSNLENTILWGRENFSWAEDEIIGIVANPFFDISIFDIFSSVFFGIRMFYLTDPSNIELSLDEIESHGITTLFSAPVFFSQIVRSGAISNPRLSKLRRIISGGDFFPAPHILAWRQHWPELDIFNVWGPTETSIVNSAHLIGEGDEKRLQDGMSPPIGKSTKRMCIEVHDQMGFKVPDGVEGELVVLGKSVGLGYLDESELNDSGYYGSGANRLFRTKDLGFKDETGSIYMTGRSGFLTKVNGFRIDLREIESHCLHLMGVANCFAYARDIDGGIQELIVFLEKSDSREIVSLANVKSHLRMKMPSYMVPKKVVFLDEFPVTRNGKVDRKSIITNFLMDAGA